MSKRKLMKASYYIQGIIAWIKTFLGLVLGGIAVNRNASLVTPAAQFCFYLVLGIRWLMTGPGKTEKNLRWIKWNKWIQMTWLLSIIQLIRYIYQFGILGKVPWLAYVGTTSEFVLWALYYGFAWSSYQYIEFMDYFAFREENF